MYIDKIDELIDSIIDDIFNNIVLKNKEFNKFLKEQNFVKFQKDINIIIHDYIHSINVNVIKENTKNNESFAFIFEIIKKYVALYVFLTIGAYYEYKDEVFINNIVEFTKNQKSFELKINNFFNSDSNSFIVELFKFIKNINTLISTEQSKLANIINKPDFKKPIEFLNSLGNDFIQLNFIKNKDKNNIHNIIKTIIILEIYKKNDKPEISRMLELSASGDEEYIFIDIVVPSKTVLDIETFEKVLSKKDIVKGLAYNFWNYMIEFENEASKPAESIDIDDRIVKLINSGILIPIVDDFLMFHKDTEKYDIISEQSSVKKKDDTRLKYIVNKLETITEFYSETTNTNPKIKDNIKKLFYTPLNNRKATLYNNNEDGKIIQKILNIGKVSSENAELMNDLFEFRKYAYANFKDINGFGFSLLLNKTVNAVRSVSFETSGEFKQSGQSSIQLRVGSNNQVINIMGFLIPTNLRPLECLKVRDTVNIKSLSKSKNGYNLTLDYITDAIIKNKDHKSSVVWLFNPNEDTVRLDNYNQSTAISPQETIRQMVGQLYNDILFTIYNETMLKLDAFKSIEIQKGFALVQHVEKQLMSFMHNPEYKTSIENKILFDKSIKTEDVYDLKEDDFGGITGNILKLPKIKTPEKSKTILSIINPSVISEKGTFETVESVAGLVCQHNISWERITEIRKTDASKYLDLLNEFIQVYITENTESDFVCRSCGFILPIKKFITDGAFDNDTGKYVPFSISMNVPLETIPEYQNYKRTINAIDKYIEKISSINNIPYLSGLSPAVKWKRRAIIKDIIDIILLNNKILKKKYKDRKEISNKKYGVSNNFNEFFIFDLEDSIFIFTSKDKDYYKSTKQNNVLSYIIIGIMLELNDSHISFMSGDNKGVCNYPVFHKYGHTLFDGLNIVVNKSGDTQSIKKYPVLCYILYIISCMITKYNMWNFVDENEKPIKGKRKFNPIIQKHVIHTTIDILNSILEVSGQKNTNYLYEIISVKLIQKLQTTFSNEALLDIFKSELDKTSIALEKKAFILSKSEPIVLTGKHIPYTFDNSQNLYKKYYSSKFVPYTKPLTFNFDEEITNITNCNDGKFHEWTLSGKIMKCKLCDVEQNKLIDKETKNIQYNHHQIILSQFAKKYCVDASLHEFIFNVEDKKNICKLCKKTNDFKYSENELNQLEKNLIKRIDNDNISFGKNIILLNEDDKKELSYQEKVVKKINDEYKSIITKDNNYKFIDILVNLFKDIIGSETNLESPTNFNITHNIYTITHDHFGNKLDKPLILSEKDGKIQIKDNHPFFKTDVIYYSSFKAGRTDIFYDAHTNIYLGYKESNRDFILAKNNDIRIVVNYSIYNKLKIFGYYSKFIDIQKEIINVQENIKVSQNKDINIEHEIKEVIKNIIRNRIKNIKNAIIEFQRFINRIKYGFKIEKKEKEDSQENFLKKEEDYNDPINTLIETYAKKLTNFNIKSDSGSHRVFKHYKAIVNNMFIDESIDDVNFNFDKNTQFIDLDDIINYDTTGNKLIFYLIMEIVELIGYNSNKFTKTNIVMFFIDIINMLFDRYNYDNAMNNNYVRRFYLIANNMNFVLDEEFSTKLENEFLPGQNNIVESIDKNVDEETNEQVIADKTNKLEDDLEAQEAIDLDLDPEDIDGDGEQEGIDFEDHYESRMTDKDMDNINYSEFYRPIAESDYTP